MPGLAPARVRHRRRNSRSRAWGVVGWWGGVPRYLLHRSSDRGWLVHTDRTQATQEPLNPSTPPLHHKDRSLCAPRRQPSKLNGGLGVFPIAETRQHERRRVLGGAWRQPKDKKRADDERGRDRNLLCMFASLWVQAREQLQSCRSLYYTPSRLNSQLGLPSHFESTQGPQLLRRVGFLPASWFQVLSTAPHHPPQILVFSPASYSLLLLLLILLPPSSTPDLDTFTTHSPNRLTTAASNRKHGVLLPTLPVPAWVHCPLLLREAHPCLWRWQHRRHLQDRGPEL